MDVNYEYYKIFYYVARYGNFTKAARALGSGQPNVTRAMNCLEEQVHSTLFIRTNRGVRLTPEGELLYRHVESAISQIQAAEASLHEASSLEHGSISIGASDTALNICLLPILKAFHEAHPRIRLKLENQTTLQAIPSVKNGEVDFAVVSTPTGVTPPLQEVPLTTYQEILVGGSTFSALGGQVLTLDELLHYPMISLGRQTMTWQFYHQWFLAHDLEFSPDTEVATADQILPLVKCGLGLAFLPEPMAQAALSSHKIVRIFLPEDVPERQICLVFDRQRPFSAAAQKLTDDMLGRKSG
ncbi:MAG: LysR family transcriptional regulator [Firmicutes bacterium]|jgi:DNA-binding transcriptional LysR family regulator|nr:LysR family transcriptional regulator [Bacillota bacterium]